MSQIAPDPPIGRPPVISDAARDTCWPNEQERRLLQAGLWPPGKALKAWTDFCDGTSDIEALDHGCYRLFSLVAVNLQNCEQKIPHKERLFSVLRHAWAQNQRLLGQMIPLLRAMREAGIEFLVLKGAALSALYYKHGGVRPMADIDLLIRPHDLKRTSAVLPENGCTVPVTLTMERLSELVRFRHELTFKSREGADLDIHWYLVSDTRHLETEDCFWRDAVPCPLPGLMCRTLGPTDQLLHTCLHGVQWNEVSAVRWLADATVIIRTGLDWDRLEARARHLLRLEPVRETILYLDELGIDLPPEQVERWRSIEITPLEKIEGGYRACLPNRRERTRQLAWAYLRLNRNLQPLEMLANIPDYMKQIHHFRAWSRRATFLFYLVIFLVIEQRRIYTEWDSISLPFEEIDLPE